MTSSTFRAGRPNGPVGIAVAVVRGGELYVSTVGPAEAYLIRSARLSTLPDPNRDRGLPTGDLSPDVWRGEINVGDSLVLISPNVIARLGPDELKDSMVTLHPQSAIEHLHHQFIAVEGSGSDGAIAFEATEVSATARQRALVPVRADEPLAGTEDRSPIPLADGVEAGVAAMTAGATRARDAAGGVFGRSVQAFQDHLPHRRAAYRKVTPFATKQETQRRAAVAVLAFVVVAVGLGFGAWVAGGSGTKADVASLSAGANALQGARDAIDEVWAPGVDLVQGDPRRARDLLESAYAKLEDAEAKGIPISTLTPLRARVVEGLDGLYKVVVVRPSVTFSFPDADPPVELTALVRGPDSQAFVIDKTSGTVLRLNARAGEAKVILRAGDTIDELEVGTPELLSVGGPDLLVLDSNNTLWRWRAVDKEGNGTVKRVRVKDSASWGDDVSGMGTFCRSGDCSLYNLYTIDPSEKQIQFFTPAADGSGYPGRSDGPPGDRPRRLEGQRHVHRRRHLARRRRRRRALRVRPRRRLAGRRPRGWPAQVGAGHHPRRVRQPEANRPAVCLRPGESADPRVRQGDRRLHRAVPTGRRQPRLEGHPWDRPQPGDRGRARDPGLDRSRPTDDDRPRGVARQLSGTVRVERSVDVAQGSASPATSASPKGSTAP